MSPRLQGSLRPQRANDIDATHCSWAVDRELCFDPTIRHALVGWDETGWDYNYQSIGEAPIEEC